MKVLVVDDYSTMRRIIKNLLMQLGYTDVEEAGDGVSALQKLRESKYGLVIANWKMEPMSGLQLVKEMRADSKFQTIPFIMMTAGSQIESETTAKGAGANSYLVKPFNAETLKQKIQAALGS
jgi:two-component system chemotaxis response regulator CheY